MTTQASQHVEPTGLIHHGDSMVLLSKLELKHFNLVFTSPPYNIGKTYERITSLDTYLNVK